MKAKAREHRKSKAQSQEKIKVWAENGKNKKKDLESQKRGVKTE